MSRLLNHIIKCAYATYDYQASRRRNYTPPKPKAPQTEQVQTGVMEKKPTTPVSAYSKWWGTNRPDYEDHRLWKSRTSPTISGSGGGRQYWTTRKNPWEY